MDETYIIISYIGHYGGIETLLLRMLTWLKKNKYRAILVSDSNRMHDKNILEEVINLNVEVLFLPFRSKCSHADMEKLNIGKNENLKIITFTYPEYVLGEQIKAHFHLIQSNIIFYVPHQFGLIIEFYIKNSLLKLFAKIIGKHLTKKMISNQEVIHMDPLCAERLEIKYGISKNKAPVIPLAMEINSINYDRIQNVFKDKDTYILSIARLEFPFKGYLFGLIQMFEDLCEKHDDIKLIIIGDGDGFQKLLEAKNSSKYSNKITLVGAVPYKELSSYFNLSKIYIGMGTSLLDAANHSIIGFPIGSYTYECKGYDFYYKDGMNLGGLYGEKNIQELVEKVLEMPKEIYIELAEKQQKEIEKFYDISAVMARISKHRNVSQHMSISKVELWMIDILKNCFTILRRKKHETQNHRTN